MKDRVQDLLGPTGAVARRLPEYEERPEQLQLAVAVERCLEDKAHLMAEAGTGIGKSFAYLLPAIVHATANRGGGPVVISTRTIALQQQLEQKDVPFLQAVLPHEWSAVTALGRNNYVCLRRMGLARKERGVLFPDRAREEQLRAVVEWSLTTTEGTRMSVGSRIDDEVWDEVKAEHGNCLHRACPFYEPCHYQKARRRMGSADILIVNHSLYMADVALRRAGANYLPAHHVVVFDEAHHLERIATEALGLRVSHASVEWQLRRLSPKRSKHSLLTQFGSATARSLVDQVRVQAQDFFDELLFCLQESGPQDTLALTDHSLDTALADSLEVLGNELSGNALDIEDLSMRTEMQARALGMLGLAAMLQSLCNAQDEATVRWIERTRRAAVLRSGPLDVAEVLSEFVFTANRSTVLVSATMDAGTPDFAGTRTRLGIDDATTLRLGSPFCYEQQVELVLEESLPDPSKDAEGFIRESKQRVLDHVLANGGRALVLCTSWRYLNAVAEHIRGPLADAGIALLVQGEQSHVELLRQKLADPTSVLVGTDSMWEGIDVPGDALTLLIITRFPFAQPGHPLTEARVKNIEQSGGSGFFDLSLPNAIIKFRQGFGRFVRTATDRGKVVVLDPRVRTKRYGREFLRALPDGVRY